MDKVRVEDLMTKSELESINSMVCSASAMLAWRASKASSPLHGLSFQSEISVATSFKTVPSVLT